MTEYHAYVIGPEGQTLNRIELLCDEENQAKERARQLVDGHAIELFKVLTSTFWIGDYGNCRNSPKQMGGTIL